MIVVDYIQLMRGAINNKDGRGPGSISNYTRFKSNCQRTWSRT